MAATSINGKIVDGLMRHFERMALPSGVDVAIAGVSYTPKSGRPYVALTPLFNTPIERAVEFDAKPERVGLLMASVFWPEGEGTVKATDLATDIGQHFKRGTGIREDGVTICMLETPDVGTAEQEGAWLQVMVRIPWAVRG